MFPVFFILNWPNLKNYKKQIKDGGIKMKEKELLKGIEEDEILQTLTQNLKAAKENAESFQFKAERRIAQLSRQLEHHYEDTYTNLAQISDLNELEHSANQLEKKSDIEMKIVALTKMKNRDWTMNKNYNEAMAQYFTYIAPILTDVEAAKTECRSKIGDIESRYKEELAKAYQEFNEYEDKVIELFSAANEQGLYIYNKNFEMGFGRIARSDDYAASKAESYNQRLRQLEPKEREPEITKHESLNGIGVFLGARPANWSETDNGSSGSKRR